MGVFLEEFACERYFSCYIFFIFAVLFLMFYK